MAGVASGSTGTPADIPAGFSGAAAADAFRTARDTRLAIEGELKTTRQALARVLGQPPSSTISVQAEGIALLAPTEARATADTSDPVLPGLEILDATPDDSLVARLERRRLDLVALRL